MRKGKLLESFRRWLGTRKKSAPVSLARGIRPKSSQRESSDGIEPLETRISPAVLVNPFTVTYHDADGDLVTVKSTKAIFTATNVNSIFKFDTGDVKTSPVTVDLTLQQLQTIDLSAVAGVDGAGLNVSAVKPSPLVANGFADVGYINAAGKTLGAVTIDGDLGRIAAGVASKTTALTSLNVNSIGERGLTTQNPADLTASLASQIVGAIGSLTVATNMKDATFNVADGTTNNVVTAPGKIGSIVINGSLIGGSAATSGLIATSSDIGLIKIAGNVTGGGGNNSGEISSGGKISSFTLGGSIYGGAGESSGIILSKGDMGAVKISGAVIGGDGKNSGEVQSGGKLASVVISGKLLNNQLMGLIGGKGFSSGLIYSKGDMGAVTIGGAVAGGDGNNSGEIFSAGKISSVVITGSLANNQFTGLSGGKGTGSGTIESLAGIGTVKIGGDVRGGEGDNSGRIYSAGKISGVAINGKLVSSALTGGSLIGGAGRSSGAIVSIDILGAVTIANDIQGGAGLQSGEVLSSDSLSSITLGGSLLGGTKDSTGYIWAAKDIGSVKIAKNVSGTPFLGTGSISAGGKIASVSIGGSLNGSEGVNSGSIFSGLDSTIPGSIGSVVVTGDVKGGLGDNSGEISSGGGMTAVSVKSLQAGVGASSGVISAVGLLGSVKVLGDVKGDAGANSGQISGNKINSVAVGGSLLGGAGANSGAILSHTFFGPDSEIQGDIGTVTVNGLFGVLGSTGNGSGQINAAGMLAGVTIAHSLTAGTGVLSGSILSGTDSLTSGKMTTVMIGGDMVNGSIRSGDDIGSITVKGNLTGTLVKAAVISARGQAVQGLTTDVAIKSLTVGGTLLGGNVEFANILAGYDTNLNPVNPDAQIGTITVLKNWTASSVVAGAYDAGAGGFGTAGNAKIAGADNAAIVSKIAGIVIGGSITGTAGGGDHFGFVAQQIASFKVGAKTQLLTAGSGTDLVDPITSTADTSLREIAV